VVPVAPQLALTSELGEGRLLVVAALRQALDGLGAERVDAGVDPMVEERRLAEAGDRPVPVEVDDAERRPHLRDDDRRGGAVPLVLVEERAEVDVEELVAVQREARAVAPTPRRREAEAAASAERLGLADRVDLRAEAAERVHERLLLPGAAGDDHPLDARLDEPRHAVLREREPRDRDERLRQSLRRLSQPLRLAPGQEQRFHQMRSSGPNAGSG